MKLSERLMGKHQMPDGHMMKGMGMGMPLGKAQKSVAPEKARKGKDMRSAKKGSRLSKALGG